MLEWDAARRRGGSRGGVEEFCDQAGSEFRIARLCLRHDGLAEVVAMPTRQDKQPCSRDQASQLQGMFEPDDIPIAEDDQRWCPHRLDGLVRHITEVLHSRRILVMHGPELLLVRIDA